MVVLHWVSFLKRKCREKETKMSSTTKSFRIDDLLKGRNEGENEEQRRVIVMESDSSIVSNSGVKERDLGSHGNSQLPLSAAPIDYSRPRPSNEKSPGVKSMCLGDEAHASGDIVNGTTDVFRGHDHVLSSVLVGNSVANNSLQFGSESDIGSNHQTYQALLTMEAHRMNQNRANFMRHHQHVSNSMLMPTYGTGLFPVAALNYPSGHLGRMGHFPVSPNYEECMYEGMALNHSRIHYSLYPYVRHGYSPCKRKGGQIRFNNSQTGQLEKAFVQQKYLNATDRKKLAQSLGLTDRQVKTWFQNRRAKYRKCKGTHDIETETEMIESPQNPRDGSPGYHCNSVRTDSPIQNDD